MKTKFDKLRETMPSNGYANIDRMAFNKRDNTPCYICENAEDLSGVFSYKSLLKLVREWLKENKER